MVKSVGLSFLYPTIPILCGISILLLLALLPGFWKTRIFALVALVSWLIIGNLLILIGMIGWHGNTHDAPIFANILVTIWHMRNVGAFGSMAVFAKFVWQRLRPMSARQLYDSRRRNNVIDAFITVLLPLLWTPTLLISYCYRYNIVEDMGPMCIVWDNWQGFLVLLLPPCAGFVAICIFNVLALLSHLRHRRTNEQDKDPSIHTSINTQKLLTMSFFNLLLAILALYVTVGKSVQYHPASSWVRPVSLQSSVETLSVVRVYDQFILDTKMRGMVHNATTRSLVTPLLGFYMFAWFGFSTEARKSYVEAIGILMRLLGVHPRAGGIRLSWNSSSRFDSPSELYGLSPFYVSGIPNTERHASPLPPKPAKVHRSSSSKDIIGVTAEGNLPSPRRLSFHKQPVRSHRPTSSEAVVVNTAKQNCTPPRRLSFHKPPLRSLAPADPPSLERPPSVQANNQDSAPPYEEICGRVARPREANRTRSK